MYVAQLRWIEIYCWLSSHSIRYTRKLISIISLSRRTSTNRNDIKQKWIALFSRARQDSAAAAAARFQHTINGCTAQLTYSTHTHAYTIIVCRETKPHSPVQETSEFRSMKSTEKRFETVLYNNNRFISTSFLQNSFQRCMYVLNMLCTPVLCMYVNVNVSVFASAKVKFKQRWNVKESFLKRINGPANTKHRKKQCV